MAVNEKKVVVIADADSRLKWVYNVALQLVSSSNIEIVIIGKMPADEQLEALPSSGLDCFEDIYSFRETATNFSQYSAVICSATGSLLNMLIVDLHNVPDRPSIITGYEGLVYEKHIEGLLWRYGSDVILVNSPADLALFSSALKELGLDDGCLHCVGFGRLAHGGEQVDYLAKNKIVFATQPSVPVTYMERAFLLDCFIKFAESNPGLEVIIKGRVKPGEGLGTPYKEKHPYELIGEDIAKKTPLPPNLIFSYERMDAVLLEARALVSISSTAMLEAMAMGVPAIALSDLGIRESYGNHFFLGAGIFSTFDNMLQMDRFDMSRSTWSEQVGLLHSEPLNWSLVKRREITPFYCFSGSSYGEYMKDFALGAKLRRRGLRYRIFLLLRRYARKWLV